MTNFSGVGRTGIWTWLSPERAVLVVPVLAGLGLSVLVFSAGITPLKLRVDEQQEVVDDLRSKADRLPKQRRKLAALKQQQAQREQQLDRLLALVAGTSTSQLNTFLAELNDLAKAHGVVITTTEPGAVQRFMPQEGKTKSGRKTKAPPAKGGGERREKADPLLNKGLEKRSAGLTVKGSFPQVLAFLQALERLQVFVIISEMDVKADAQPTKEEGKASVPEVTMTLKLTAYGRQPAAEPAQEPN